MARGVLPAREALLWATAFVLIAAWLVAVRFTSDDPDSALYASISARLSHEPVSRWLAPEWWGFWPEAGMTGLFREHPAGIYLVPAALARLGIPGEQAAYIVGVAAGLLSVISAGLIVGRLAGRDAARATLVLIQVMPVAFIFRIRANHEYPMLLCLLVALLALDNLRRSRWWMLLVAAAVTSALLVKGVFVVLVLAGAVLWIAIDPTEARVRGRQMTALAAAAVTALLVALLYDAAYLDTTGETFWQGYWARQLGPLRIATPLQGAAALAGNTLFYLSRLIWLPAPWSLALVVVAWRWRADIATSWRGAAPSVRRGLGFALAFAAASVLILSPSNRYAERYAFSATYVVAAAGIVAACWNWTRLRQRLERLDERVPALPVLVWLLLMALRLVAGPLLPRL